MTNIIPLRRPSIARLECSACGATADAACNCGAPYLPAGQRAAEAVAANPEKSNRAIADIAKVDEKTVRKVRRSTADSPQLAKRVGKDGKARKLPTIEPKSPVSSGAEPVAETRAKLSDEIDPLLNLRELLGLTPWRKGGGRQTVVDIY